MHLKLQCLNDEARQMYGKHGHYKEGDSGLDLFCVAEEQTIKAGETAFIKLGLKASAWNSEGKNVSFLLFPRSSISKTPLRLANSVGLIDAGYRGELMAAVDNIKSADHTVKRGDRLVQAVSFSGEPLTFELVESLDQTARGEGGFGSTDKTASSSSSSTEKAKEKGESDENSQKRANNETAGLQQPQVKRTKVEGDGEKTAETEVGAAKGAVSS